MITTKRHIIKQLSETDAFFILELLNTEGWITYIGNRDINSEVDALHYIQRINSNPDIDYRTVILKETHTTLGLITIIKRDYLECRDIGFAFLPAYTKQGHAYEATKAILDTLNENILAITLPENKASIRLIEKLGLNFKGIIENENEKLFLYSSQE